MKKQMYFIIAAALCGVATLVSCGGGNQQMQMPQATFKTGKVTTKTVTLNSKYSATIRGRQDIDIYPQVGGTLQQVCVKEGQKVSKGQTLFIIDQVPYQAALNTAEAALEAAKSQLATAELNYTSKQTLLEQKVISDFEFKTAYNSYLSAKAAVAQANAQVVNARNSLSYTVVKSPADGVVGTLPFRQGALVGPQMPMALTTVSDNNQMYVYFSISEAEFLQMVRDNENADKAIAAMPELTLQLVDGSEYDIKGKVESASGVVDRATGSVQLRATFANPNHILHSGSTGNVILPVTYKDVMVVPAGATVQLQDKHRVFLVDKDGIAHGKIVTVMADANGSEFIVKEGLTEKDEFVIEGAGMVKEGQKVKNLSEK